MLLGQSVIQETQGCAVGDMSRHRKEICPEREIAIDLAVSYAGMLLLKGGDGIEHRVLNRRIRDSLDHIAARQESPHERKEHRQGDSVKEMNGDAGHLGLARIIDN